MHGSRRLRANVVVIPLILSLQSFEVSLGFVTVHPRSGRPSSCATHQPLLISSSPSGFSSTSLHVWWYGGSETVESFDVDADSCELVAVRIERTSPNSRRIFGDISIAAPLRDVWSILTDYNRLAVHVPNLVESKIERVNGSGEMGDGQFQCRLYQKGAQKIIGFEFGASVTMDMKESVLTRPSPSTSSAVNGEKRITFKCVDSFFFKEFDGEWRVKEFTNKDGDIETLLSYVVDVRPKGPVPVAALEWRIREDVPTNLRAVKKAALAVGYEGVMSKRPNRSAAVGAAAGASVLQTNKQHASRLALARDTRGKIQWYKDETMEAYLTDQ